MTFREIKGGVCAAAGFQASASYAGIRKTEKDDLVLIVSDTPATAAGTLTLNQTRAWCVQHNERRLKVGKASAIVCFAGNANACNGVAGKRADEQLADDLRSALGGVGKTAEVLTASTGVIGRPLQYQLLAEALPKAVERLGKNSDAAAAGIMTTDLVPKSCAVEFEHNGKPVRVGGISKGSGMIAPNMATMLAFITTDVAATPAEFQKAFAAAVAQSFNRITVDGDTSTNDMALGLANGRSGVRLSDCEAEFQAALNHVCRELAKAVARDGEGATKLITVTVKNAPSGAEKIAKTVAESPLVKTACFGNDPNWGRILAAAGRAGVPFKPEDVVIRIAGIELFRGGEPAPFDAARVSGAMKTKDLDLEIEFMGDGETVMVWTCDFSYDYVKINADYTT